MPKDAGVEGMWKQISRRIDQVQLIRRLPLIGVVCCCMTLALGGLTLWGSFTRKQADTQQDIRELGAVLADHAARYIQVADILLRDVQFKVRSQGVTTPEALKDAFDSSRGPDFMGALVRTLRPDDGVALFGADGALLSRGRQGGGFSVADRPLFAWLRDHRDDKIFIDGPWRSRATGVMSVFAARRIEGPDGRFLGVVVASLATQYLSDLYRSITHGRPIDVSLMREDGILLVRYPPFPGSADPRQIAVRPGSPFFDHLGQGGGSFRTAGYLTDHDRFAALNLVPGYPLVVTVAEDTQIVWRTWLEKSSFEILITLALAFAVLVMFQSIARAVRSQEEHAASLADYAAALRASEERLDRAQEIAGLGSWEQDIETGQNIWSRNLFRIRGIDPSADVCEAALAGILPADEVAARRSWLAALAAGGDPGARDLETLRSDGTACVLQIEGRAIVDPDGRVRRLAGTTRDVTQLRLLERGLIQSQKMEAIGNLAGGISHDFNNLLGVIIGNLDLLRTLIPDGTEAAELCDEALEGAIRGADLIKRLLAFARRQPLQPQLVEVNALVADAGRLLSRALGDGVLLRMDLGLNVGSVMVDPVQLQASLVNLGTNARDAMPVGGRLSIRTHAVLVTAQNRQHHDSLTPGLYAVVTVRDTGTGMDADVLKHIFEPFFTTKAPEKGSGLGLSMVFGFISQSGGHLSVRSEPGVGSSFRLYLPSVTDGDVAVPVTSTPARPALDGETVLLVNENADYRRTTARQLSALGYKVRAAADADTALQMLERRDRVDFLLTELLPQGRMDGIDLAEAAVRLRPDLRVVLMAGWQGVREMQAKLACTGWPILCKPFFTDELAVTLHGQSLRQPVW